MEEQRFKEEPLDLAMAMAVRRARVDYRASRRADDEECKATGTSRSGGRLKMGLAQAERAAVGLADEAARQATLLEASREAVERAHQTALAFVHETRQDILHVAIAITKGWGRGRATSFVEDHLQKLDDAVSGAFKLVSLGPPPHPSPVEPDMARAKVARRKAGRPVGTGQYAAADDTVVAEMRSLIVAGKATSPWGAAQSMSERIQGSRHLDSHIKRVVTRYREKHSA